ncbi:MAG: methylmalonyl-CoA epimerase [Deltaproteobacteria bacterium]|nr:methylmalonyl-CoA epimerase [Deltaproteobacteria bacterium]
MKLKLDHIAVAVSDLGAALAAFEQQLGLACDRVEEVPEQGARVAFLDLDGSHLELVQALDAGSPIARSIAKRGEGLHHVCFEVPSLDQAIAGLTAKGVQLATQPTPGAKGSRVVFVHPKSMNGVLVELVEKAPPPC